jgi:RNA recognition motif-containing protein
VTRDGEGDHSRIIVGNLQFSVTEEELRAELAKYCTIVELTVPPWPDNRSMGLGVVDVPTNEEADRIYDLLNRQMFLGGTCYIQFDGGPRRRSRQRPAGRPRPRSIRDYYRDEEALPPRARWTRDEDPETRRYNDERDRYGSSTREYDKPSRDYDRPRSARDSDGGSRDYDGDSRSRDYERDRGSRDYDKDRGSGDYDRDRESAGYDRDRGGRDVHKKGTRPVGRGRGSGPPSPAGGPLGRRGRNMYEQGPESHKCLKFQRSDIG